nr:hypothetical protein [Pedobacter panaciterrae]
MKFKKVDYPITSFGFIAGLAVGIVVGVLFTQAKTAGKVKEGQTNEQTDLIKTNEVADHLAYLGHKAEQSAID